MPVSTKEAGLSVVGSNITELPIASPRVGARHTGEDAVSQQYHAESIDKPSPERRHASRSGTVALTGYDAASALTSHPSRLAYHPHEKRAQLGVAFPVRFSCGGRRGWTTVHARFFM